MENYQLKLTLFLEIGISYLVFHFSGFAKATLIICRGKKAIMLSIPISGRYF